MDGTFELNKPGNYTVELFEENSFINDKNSPADLAKFGKTYSVKFQNDAETYLWTTKTKPIEDKAYYGHIQETSGKSLRFKLDKLPDGNFSTGPAMDKSTYKDHSKDITLGMVWKTVAGIRGLPEDDEQFAKFFEIVDSHLQELLRMSDKLGGSQGEPTVVPTPSVEKTATQAEESQPATIHQKLAVGFSDRDVPHFDE